MIVAEKIQILRKRNALSQEQLAEKLDVSRQSVSKWESNQSIPELSKIIALCEMFHITTDQLLKDNVEIDVTDEYMPVTEEAITGLPTKIEIIFCTHCGKENRSDSQFCAYCGNLFTSYLSAIASESGLTKEDMDLAFYKANLQMQQQSMKIQKQQVAEQQKQIQYQQRQMELQLEQTKLQKQQNDSVAKCPRCGSTSLSGNKKGYGIGKGVLGAVVLGPIGLVAGNMGSKKVVITCMNCGHKFRARKFKW